MLCGCQMFVVCVCVLPTTCSPTYWSVVVCVEHSIAVTHFFIFSPPCFLGCGEVCGGTAYLFTAICKSKLVAVFVCLPPSARDFPVVRCWLLHRRRKRSITNLKIRQETTCNSILHECILFIAGGNCLSLLSYLFST